MPYVQDLHPVAGGEQVRRIRGRTFTLWPNAVASNRALPEGLRIAPELAEKIQEASRQALAAIGMKKADIEAREFFELYPECRSNAEIRQMSREALKAFHKNAPHPAMTFRWMQIIQAQETGESAAAIAEAAEKAAAPAKREKPAKRVKAGAGVKAARGE